MGSSRAITFKQGIAGYGLAGRLLVAVPSMSDPRFARSVIYVCSHSPEGAMGIVVNRLHEDLAFSNLLKQLDIPLAPGSREVPIHFGGPVEPGRGFVLHSADYKCEGTVPVGGHIALTTTVEVLQSLAEGVGPVRAILALGYAGWGAGQLDAEIQANGWMVAPADESVVFGRDMEGKWERALASLGTSPAALSGEVGHA